MWGFIAQIGIWAGLYVANWLLKPKDKSKAYDPESMRNSLPKTEEGASIPIVFGRTRVTAPVLVWNGKLKQQQYTLANMNVVQYGLDMLFVVGIPMTGAASMFNSLNPLAPRLYRVWIGDKKLPMNFGKLPGTNGVNTVLAQTVHRKGFHGGPGQGGGIFGAFQWWWGGSDQNIWLPPSRIGNLIREDLEHGDNTLTPGFRNQMMVSFHDDDPDGAFGIGKYATDGADDTGSHPPNWTVGEGVNVDGYSFEVGTYGAMDPTVTAMTDPGDDYGGDADPAEVLYDVLTAEWSKLSTDPSRIDKASFLAASTTLKAEGHGYSMAHYDQSEGLDILTAVLKQIDAALYEEPTTGKLTLKLIRADYVAASLPVFDESNIVEVEDYGIGGWKDCANEVRVNYTDRNADYKTGTAVAQSLANATTNANRRRVQVISYPGISNAAIAGRVAARDLNVLSRPLKKITLILNRDAYALRPGSCFKVSYSEYNLSAVIFRCGRVDVGQLFDNKVVVDAVEDVFASTYVGMGLPWGFLPIAMPYPFFEQHVFESPYWLALQAKNMGLVNSQNVPRLFHVARPTINATAFSSQSRMQSQSSSSSDASKVAENTSGPVFATQYQADLPQMALPTTFTVLADYSRTKEPYDTVTGMSIGQLEDPSRDAGDITESIALSAVSDAAIEQDGQNLVLIVTPSGDMEIMAFEIATTVDAGVTFTLEDVWRGLMDTPPIDIPAGSRGWFIAPNYIGRRGFAKGQTANHHMIPHAPYVAGSGDDERGSVLMRARSWLPYPLSDVRLAGENIAGTLGVPSVALHYKAVSLLEEAFDVYGRERDRRSPILERGDTADVVATDFSPTTYYPFGINDALVSPSNPQGYGVASTADGTLDDVAGARAGGVLLDGYGTFRVQMRSSRTILNGPDPALGVGGIKIGDVLTTWDPPEIEVSAPEWRNLMANVRFAYATGTPWWTLVNMSVQTGTTGLSRNAGAKWIQGGTSPCTAQQNIPVANWLPRGMTAIGWGFYRNFAGDVNDTQTFVIRARDTGGGSLGTGTTAALAGATTFWTWFEVSVVIPANTTQLRWETTGAAVGGGSTAQVGLTECGITVGQIYNNTLTLLTNPGFAGSTASWTVSVGNFTIDTGIASPSLAYLRGGTAATNTLFQEFTLPAGFECGTYAVVRAWRAQIVTGDTGELKIEAMDAASVVLATATTGAEQMTNLNEWYLRTLACDIPDGSTKVRVTFTAIKTTGANSGACLDEVRLALEKKLAPAFEEIIDYATFPQQEQPGSWQEYERAFTGLFDELGFDYLDRPRPLAVFSGEQFLSSQTLQQQSSASHAIEWSDNVEHVIGRLVGHFADGRYVDAFNFQRQSGGSALCIEARDQAINSLCAFDSTKSFTVICYFRVDELTFSGVKCGLVGRRDLTAGWGLEISAGGKLQAEFEGDAGVITATSAGMSVVDGAFHMGVLEYNASTQEINIYDESGPITTVSTAAGLGEFGRVASQCRFRIGRSSNFIDTLPGMISCVYVFEGTLGEDAIAGHWNYAIDVNAGRLAQLGISTAHSRNVPAWCQVGRDTAFGNGVACFGTQQVPYTAETGSNGAGLALAKQNTNRIPSWDFAGASWTVDVGASLVQGVQSVSGALEAVDATVTAAAGLKLIGVTGTATTTFQLVFWARAAIATNLTLELMNASDVVKNSQAVVVGTTWTRHVVSFTGWDNSTATLRIRWRSTAGTVTFTLGHVIWGQEGTEVPVLYPGPLATLNDTTVTYTLSGNLPRQFNSEGEIEIAARSLITAPTANGSIVNVKNNTNSQNRRELLGLSTGALRFDHYDGAAANTSSTGTVFDWAQAFSGDVVWYGRARWCRAMTLDNAATPFAGVVTFANVSSAIYGRSATFSESSTKEDVVEVNKGSSAGVNLIMASLTIRAREEKLV